MTCGQDALEDLYNTGIRHGMLSVHPEGCQSAVVVEQEGPIPGLLQSLEVRCQEVVRSHNSNIEPMSREQQEQEPFWVGGHPGSGPSRLRTIPAPGPFAPWPRRLRDDPRSGSLFQFDAPLPTVGQGKHQRQVLPQLPCQKEVLSDELPGLAAHLLQLGTMVEQISDTQRGSLGAVD